MIFQSTAIKIEIEQHPGQSQVGEFILDGYYTFPIAMKKEIWVDMMLPAFYHRSRETVEDGDVSSPSEKPSCPSEPRVLLHRNPLSSLRTGYDAVRWTMC